MDILQTVSTFADLISVAGFIGIAWGGIASIFLWRARFRRHKFSRVYFPRNRQDFYDYYVRMVSCARKNVCITSDGFNMCNPESRAAAASMNAAQDKAIKRGATVERYQMTETMHINWLYQIVLMKKKHGKSYRTYVNPAFESVGNFAVLDAGTRRSVVEFMLPNPGGLTQSTTARDFGFIHGHVAKSDATRQTFIEIGNHPDTIEVTEENFHEIARTLFDKRLKRHLDPTSNFHLFDEEILKALRTCPVDRLSFEQVQFEGWPSSQPTNVTPVLDRTSTLSEKTSFRA